MYPQDAFKHLYEYFAPIWYHWYFFIGVNSGKTEIALRAHPSQFGPWPSDFLFMSQFAAWHISCIKVFFNFSGLSTILLDKKIFEDPFLFLQKPARLHGNSAIHLKQVLLGNLLSNTFLLKRLNKRLPNCSFSSSNLSVTTFCDVTGVLKLSDFIFGLNVGDWGFLINCLLTKRWKKRDG